MACHNLAGGGGGRMWGKGSGVSLSLQKARLGGSTLLLGSGGSGGKPLGSLPAAAPAQVQPRQGPVQRGV